MQRKKSEIRKKAGPVIIAFLLILVASGVFLVQKFMPSRERMEPSEYFGELEQKEVAVVLQDHLTDKKGILEGDDLYLEYSLVRESLNSRFFWDEENQQMLFTTALETYEIPVDSADYMVDGEERQYGKAILLQRASGLYLSADFLQLYTNVQYTLERESSHVLIRNQWGMQLAAVVKKDAAVRYQGGIKSPILTDVHEGDTVYILDELENWFEVLTPDGYIGYVQSKRLEDVKEIEVTREFKEQEYSSISLGEKVNLIWHQIDNYDGNAYLEEDTSHMTGVNVISPTWYTVKDNAGEIDSLANFFDENDDIVDEFIYLLDIHKIKERGMMHFARGYVKERGYKADKAVYDKLKASLKAMEEGNIDRFVARIDEVIEKCDAREAGGDASKTLLPEDAN